MIADLPRRLTAEFAGAMFLAAVAIGSGIMGAELAGGSEGLALIANTLATAAMLYVLITALGPISSAHFNPAVTLAFLLRRESASPTPRLMAGSIRRGRARPRR